MSEEEKEQFQSSNTCWIFEKLIDDDDEKVRDHCYITGKLKAAAHWGCNINLQSHSTFCDINKFDVKIDVMPNRLEKRMAFF